MVFVLGMCLPFLPLVLRVLARRAYRQKTELERQLILTDSTLSNRLIRRPWLRLGEQWSEQRGPAPLTILPPNPYLKALPLEIHVPDLLKGTFAIQRTSRPHRCEICHQDDQFEPNQGHCHRCNHQTL